MTERDNFVLCSVFGTLVQHRRCWLVLTYTHLPSKWAPVCEYWNCTTVSCQYKWRLRSWRKLLIKVPIMSRAVLAFLIIMFGINTQSFARCSCECVGGNVVPICQNATDLQPICPARICPLTPPSISPLQNPSLPPLGTSNCQQQQVLNPATGRYEWRNLCR